MLFVISSFVFFLVKYNCFCVSFVTFVVSFFYKLLNINLFCNYYFFVMYLETN